MQSTIFTKESVHGREVSSTLCTSIIMILSHALGNVFSSILSCVSVAYEYMKKIVFDDDSGKEEKNMMENLSTYNKVSICFIGQVNK